MWKIIKILDNQKFFIPFNIKKNTIEKFKFAFLMAKIFKQYIFYRPHWIDQFEMEKNILKFNIDEQWQIKLWIKIIDDIKKNNQSIYNFSNLFTSFKLLIKEKKIQNIHLPDRLFIMSSFSLNPSYIKIFKKISLYINIYFLYITPYKYNIFNKITNHKSILKNNIYKKNILYNSLIKLWGKYAKIYEFHIIESEKIKIENCFKKNKNSSLLNNIKNDFLNEHQLFLNKQKRLLEPKDHSISINICDNKKNEIEILHEKLLLFLHDNPSITPGDIIITSTSIETYIPYIYLIFNKIDKKKQIPFFISQDFDKKTKIIFFAFKKILNLSNSRFENQEILEFLDVPEIANKFNISDEEIKILYNWIEETNIRWAIDYKHKNDLSFPQNKQNTWLYGIEKLLLSYSMNNTENIWNNILSCSLINGSRVELISKLIIFINQLKKWQKKLSKSKNIKYWSKLANDLIDDFFSYNEETEKVFQNIQKKWKKTINDCIISCYLNKISINILKKIFFNKCDFIHNEKILPGVINFCHPSVVFSIPFKIICIIGADSQSLPQEYHVDYFNLLKKYPLIGDYNIYEKYCYLFLQSISCAEKYFYISYVGYSLKDQSKIHPSILVDQLLYYIALNFYLIGDENLNLYHNTKKIIQHLCKRYKKPYFYKTKTININITNTLQYRYKYIDKKINSKHLLDKNSCNEINLKDLINFWKHPIRYFFNFNLNIKFNKNKKIIQNTEPFSVNQLDAFEIKNILLKKIIHNQNTDQVFQHYLSSGKLPYGIFGKIFWDKTIKEIRSIADLVIKFRIKTKEQKINLNVKKYKIIGLLSEIQDTGLLRWKPNIINYSDRMSLWLEHLIYSILGNSGESKIIGYKKQIWSFSSLDSDLALFYLLKYIKGYIQGIKKPILLTKSGASWLEKVYDIKNDIIKDDENTKQEGKKKILETWIGNIFSEGEENDFYIRKIFIELNEYNIQKICVAAQKWLTPILKYRKK